MSTSQSVRSLEDLLVVGLSARGHAPLAGIRRRRSDYSTSAPIDEVTVELQDGSRLELMAKKLGTAALLDAAARAKPDFASSSTREPAVYAHVVDEVGPPRCWGTVHEGDGPLLVLERVPGLALRHVGDLRLWQAAATWLAGFHGRWPDSSSRPLPAELRRHLLRYDRSHHVRLLERAAGIAGCAGRALPPGVAEQHGRAIGLLEELPETLLHGEFYASNVIVDPSATPARVAPIDWEMAGVGPPLLDLAALVSGAWEPDERQGIVDAYRSASDLDLPWPVFEEALVAAELLISTQWMGWARAWQPPDDLAGDWARNAAAKAVVLEGVRGSESIRAERQLIVNADDLGLTDGVNQGIFDAFDHGIVTSASLMVRGEAAAAAVAGAAQRPGLALGLHVDLGEWVFRDGDWVLAYEIVDCGDAEAVEAEIAHQLGVFRALAGRDPTHLDSHQHVHREPAVEAVLVRLAGALAVPLRGVGGIAYCGAFYGQLSTGEPHPAAITVDGLVQLLDGLPPGVTELACHPGYADATTSVYGVERFRELQVLCHPRVAEALDGAGVQLLSFAEVARR